MTTYVEKLKSPEWEKCRLEIIESNHWCCENCQNKKIEQHRKGLFNDISPYNASKLAQEKGLFCFVVQIIDGMWSYDAFYWTKDENLIKELNSKEDITVFYDSKKESYLKTHYRIIALQKEDKWIYVNDMHVHHTYYQVGLDPWEYPKNSLQALCWDCHEKLHENTYIPHLDINGKEIGKLKNCRRCGGAGYLPEFFYHENGICFECNGERYHRIE